MLWYTEDIYEKKSSSSCYKLTDWPQPNQQNDRQMIFKIAACFERGASIQQVVNKTHYSEEQINKFVTVGLLSQVLKQISSDESKLIEDQPQSTSVLRGFFGKLRKKLGL